MMRSSPERVSYATMSPSALETSAGVPTLSSVVG